MSQLTPETLQQNTTHETALDRKMSDVLALAEAKFGRCAPAQANIFRNTIADIRKEMQDAALTDGQAGVHSGIEKTLDALAKQLRSISTSVDVVVIGSGQYTLGDSPKNDNMTNNRSDKGPGIILPSLCYLRQHEGTVDRIGIVGTRGVLFPLIRDHVKEKIADGLKLDAKFESFPDDNVASDPQAYIRALDTVNPSAVIIVTPDDTHFQIAKHCVQRGIHVLMVKPLVKTLAEHRELLSLATERGVLIQGEYHKQFDHFFQHTTAHVRSIMGSGKTFSRFNSEIAQPYTQLEAFGWAGTGSDINYYLNSHFMFFLSHALEGFARPTSLTAHATWGNERGKKGLTPDNISVQVNWVHFKNNDHTTGALDHNRIGLSVFNAGWVNEPGAVHTQQRCYLKAGHSDIHLDQAQRGLQATSTGNSRNQNPHFMDFMLNEDGAVNFRGRYGFESVRVFIDNVMALKNGTRTLADLYRSPSSTPSIANSVQTTAMLEAATLSWKNNGMPVKILYEDPHSHITPTGFEMRRAPAAEDLGQSADEAAFAASTG